MKPAPFAFERPNDVATVLTLLAQAGDTAKVMAGGQSLGPMLNLRLAAPALVVDISGIAELRRVEREAGTIVLGACVTHADVEDGRAPDVGADVLARVARGIAYRAVRNRGTIGGSLSHADPAADWVSSLTALGAEVEIASRAGRRRVALQNFLTGALATVLKPDELLVAVRVPLLSATARFGYVKHCRKVGEFAHAIGAALVDPAAGPARLVIGAVDAPPLVLSGDFDPGGADAALVRAGMSDPVDRHMHVEVLRRAVLQASPDLRRAA